MENQNQLPSKSRLAKASGIALVVALFLLFTAVLPAEYGYDPLRTRRAALGLTGISQAQPPEVPREPPPALAPGQASSLHVPTEDL